MTVSMLLKMADKIITAFNSMSQQPAMHMAGGAQT